MKLLAAAVVALIFGSSEAVAMPYDRFVQGYGNPGYDIYLASLGDGIYWANVSARESGHPIYCPPDALAITTEQYLALLTGFASAPDMPPVKNEEVGMVLVFALKDAFPCPP
jgi:hypothetical protein